MLWLALAARNSGTRPSALLSIDSEELAALDFDLACTQRLQEYDAEVAIENAKRIGREVALATWGDGSQSPSTSKGGGVRRGETTVEEIHL